MEDVILAAVWLDIGRSLREAFFMFWQTLWPLVLGFGLSGAVQAFVSREAMQRRLGNHGPAAVARASGYGMLSSSCSYAASATAKSLFAKGADFISATVYMFASTNLVIELGIVLAVLMGWQFAVSEFAGGAIMIVLLVVLGGLWLRGRSVAAARERVIAAQASGGGDHCHHHDDHGGHGSGGGADGIPQAQPPHARIAEARMPQAQVPLARMPLARRPLARRLRSKAGWTDAAVHTMADLTMLSRELLIGYTVAGFLAVLVPVSAWHALFLTGHGWWTSAENAVVGPFVAIISFVCSIGNVPLAAALWKGGISFGGVVSFIFADLITFPLLLVYRRYYGPQMAARMLALFWAVMAIAGLVTEGIFRAAGLIPAHRPTVIASTGFAWNYTTYLNIIFLAVFGLIYWASRNRKRLGAGAARPEESSAPAALVAHH
jgi:uncharacterized protein